MLCTAAPFLAVGAPVVGVGLDSAMTTPFPPVIVIPPPTATSPDLQGTSVDFLSLSFAPTFIGLLSL
jgi:hypothetical protein